MLTPTTRVLPGVDYFAGFIGDPDQALHDVTAQTYSFRTAQPRRGVAYGREYLVPRLEAWYGPLPYRFNGATFPAREAPPVVAALKLRLECFLPGVEFSGCLVNVYRDGRDYVSWHSDDEPDMGDPIVASVSLGAERDFLLRAIRPVSATASALVPNRGKIKLGHGSLLVMGRGVQGMYQHSLPRRANAGLRINLTFRAPG